MKDVGIDVGARELVLCDSDTGQVRRFTNNASGHGRLIKALGGSARVCLESTGIYHFDLAVALNEAKCCCWTGAWPRSGASPTTPPASRPARPTGRMNSS